MTDIDKRNSKNGKNKIILSMSGVNIYMNTSIILDEDHFNRNGMDNKYD